jgi:hypothetical protein
MPFCSALSRRGIVSKNIDDKKKRTGEAVFLQTVLELFRSNPTKSFSPLLQGLYGSKLWELKQT